MRPDGADSSELLQFSSSTFDVPVYGDTFTGEIDGCRSSILRNYKEKSKADGMRSPIYTEWE